MIPSISNQSTIQNLRHPKFIGVLVDTTADSHYFNTAKSSKGGFGVSW